MTVLTEEFVLQKTRAKNLSAVRNLNFWGSDIEDVSILPSMPNLEVISASVNKISDLGWFAHLSRLQELYLRKNEVHCISELDHLRDLPNLSVLWLNENPCAQEPHYRETTIAMLKRLTKLDGIDITVEERCDAEASFGQRQEEPSPPRNNGRPPSGKKPSTPRGSQDRPDSVPAPVSPPYPTPQGAREPSPRGLRQPSPRTERPSPGERQAEYGRARMSPRTRSNQLKATMIIVEDLELDELMVLKTEVDAQMRRKVIQNARA